jgi:hypothetical protein
VNLWQRLHTSAQPSKTDSTDKEPTAAWSEYSTLFLAQISSCEMQVCQCRCSAPISSHAQTSKPARISACACKCCAISMNCSTSRAITPLSDNSIFSYIPAVKRGTDCADGNETTCTAATT